MKAIVTKFLPATNTRGARIKAYDMDGNATTISYPHDEHNADKHRRAAEALCKKMGWTGAKRLVEGSIKGGCVFCFR